MLSMWDPFADLNRIHRELERSVAPRARNGGADFSPPVDVHEDKEALTVCAEVPGLKREEIDISLDGNVLTLKGERKLQKDEQGKRYHLVERSYGSFVRYFQLPTTVDPERIEAKLSDGLLTLRLPKKDVVKARKIEVRGDGN